MRGKGGCRSASDLSHLIAFDSITPQTGAFGPCGLAERNFSAIPDALTRLSAQAIRGFDSGFGLSFVVGPLAPVPPRLRGLKDAGSVR